MLNELSLSLSLSQAKRSLKLFDNTAPISTEIDPLELNSTEMKTEQN